MASMRPRGSMAAGMRTMTGKGVGKPSGRGAAMRYEKSAADRRADAAGAKGMAKKDTSFVKKMEDSDIEV